MIMKKYISPRSNKGVVVTERRSENEHIMTHANIKILFLPVVSGNPIRRGLIVLERPFVWPIQTQRGRGGNLKGLVAFEYGFQVFSFNKKTSMICVRIESCKTRVSS